jgi:hypothetical protein
VTAAAPSPADTARVWTEDDPEPGLDVTAVVDEDGVTWARCTCNVVFDGNPPSRYWHQHLITHLPGGWITGGSIENTWDDLWGSVPFGSSVREATDQEAARWIEVQEVDDHVR